MPNMNCSLPHQGQRLLQIGIVLILYSSVEGFVIPYFGSPRVGLSAHTLGALEGVLLLALGLLWPKLSLRAIASRLGFGICSTQHLQSWAPIQSLPREAWAMRR
jgi:hydroxylaminobenzene mutase